MSIKIHVFKKSILWIFLIVFIFLGTTVVAAKLKDVIGVEMLSPGYDQNLNINDNFIMTCSAITSDGAKYPIVTYTQQYCDNSACSGTVKTITINNDTEVITLQSGSDNPESMGADGDQINTVIAKNPGTVYVRCKVTGGQTCSGGCYSITKKVVISGECSENETRQCGATDVGACQYGYETCENGRWSECTGNIDPITEICNNSIDDDCDGAIDENPDSDNDGFGVCSGDCDDNNPNINPSATEVCNNIDDDCDDAKDEDFDLDGDNYTTCGIQDEEILVGDNTNPRVYVFDNTSGGIINTFNLTGLPSGRWPKAIEVGDINNDTKMEIIVGTSADTSCAPNCNNLVMFYRNVSGTWANYYNSTLSNDCAQGFFGLAVGDVNNDSVDDVVATGDEVFFGYSIAFVILYNQSAASNYTESILVGSTTSSCSGANYGGWGAAIGDLNQNGINEIFLEQGVGTRKILIYEWNGTIIANRANITLGSSDVIDQMDVGDLNNNTNTLELLVCGPGTGSVNTFRIYNWSSGTTYNLVWTSPNLDAYVQSCGIVDLNNNGVNDIVAMTQKMRFFEYNGTNGNIDFRETWNSTQTGSAAQRAADSGDIDRDGKAEFVTDYAGSADFTYFQNDTSEQAGPPFQNISLATFTASGTCVADIDGDSGTPLDCNDSDPSIHPGATEICGDGIDQDCDGKDLECLRDNDHDTYYSNVDCNDNNPLINPSAAEICDGQDNDCDKAIDEGFDYDACSQKCNAGAFYWINNGGSLNCCGDDTGEDNPYQAVETICDGNDNDCDGAKDEGCPKQICGNGVCEGNGENCITCPVDCRCLGRDCVKACCGDGICFGETVIQCPVDCA